VSTAAVSASASRWRVWLLRARASRIVVRSRATSSLAWNGLTT
jgi:hypothetical protein